MTDLAAPQDSRLERRLHLLLEEAERAIAGWRRDGDEIRPLGPKATRTRELILATALEVFIEHGYAATTLNDVSDRAGVSLGTVYQYFRDKRDLVITIVAAAVLESAGQIFVELHPHLLRQSGPAATEPVVASYIRHYAGSADFQRVWEEVTLLEPAVAELRHELIACLELSLAESFERGQAEGVIDPDLATLHTARALTAMVDRTCYLTFVVDGAGRRAVPDVIATLSHVWAKTLFLDQPSPAT